MNLTEFKQSAVKEPVSTANGWGFAGYYGHTYTIGEHMYRQAKWGYRHAPSTPYNGYHIGGVEVSKITFTESIAKLQICQETQVKKETKKEVRRKKGDGLASSCQLRLDL